MTLSITRLTPITVLLLSLITLASGQETADDCLGHAPPPTGEYAVAELLVDVVDPDRIDRLDARGGKRRFPVRFYYPVEGEAASEPYAVGGLRDVVLSAWPLEATSLARRCVQLAASTTPPAGESFPAVVFSHGLSWPAAVYRSMLIDLASHGYVVAAVTHTHAASRTAFASGETIDMSLWPRIDEEERRQAHLADYLDEWIADIRHVADRLQDHEWRQRLPFADNVDLGPGIGVYGHSYGASAAIRAVDGKVIRAAVAMEGRYRGPLLEDGRYVPGGPVAHLLGSYNRLELEGTQYRPGRHPLYEYVIHGAWHASFSDLVLLYREDAPPEWIERHRNELPPERSLRIVETLAAAFFDAWLKGEDSPYLHPVAYGAAVDAPSTGGFPEVELHIDVSAPGTTER